MAAHVDPAHEGLRQEHAGATRDPLQFTPLSINGIPIGMYPDEGDAGGRKTYLSELNHVLHEQLQPSSTSSTAPGSSSPSSTIPVITTVGWYAQTYPREEFTGFQLLPLIEDLKASYLRYNRSVKFIYECSIMPFQSWEGYSASNNVKAQEVAMVIGKILDASKVPVNDPNSKSGGDGDGEDDRCIEEIRLRFGHEVNYYIRSGMYPRGSDPVGDEGKEYREAFRQVTLACRSHLPAHYSARVKMWYCPNIASRAPGRGALEEYKLFLPDLQLVDYVGIDYYCPAPGCCNVDDFVKKMKVLHDACCTEERKFLVGETGLHFDTFDNQSGNITEDQQTAYLEAKLKWLNVLTSNKTKQHLPHLKGISWFNYQKDRDYRVLFVPTHTDQSQKDPQADHMLRDRNAKFAQLVQSQSHTTDPIRRHTIKSLAGSNNNENNPGNKKTQKNKVKSFFNTLIPKK